MDNDPGRVPFIPDAATVPPGSKLLVRLREVGGGRLEIATIWSQKGETFWLDGGGLTRLDPGLVVDAQLLTPDAPFGSVPWAELDHAERAQLYYGALQALCARPSFERQVADAWVRAANKLDGLQETAPASLVNRLRRDAMADARATIEAALVARVDVEKVIGEVNVTAIMRDWLRSTAWDGGASKLKALVRERLDAKVADAVKTELDAQLQDTFEYLRKAVGMAVNNAIGRLGTANAAKAAGHG